MTSTLEEGYDKVVLFTLWDEEYKIVLFLYLNVFIILKCDCVFFLMDITWIYRYEHFHQIVLKVMKNIILQW